jgi:hypothetical protein
VGPLEIWREPFAAVWPEVQVLTQKHYEEVDGGVEPKRKHAVDAAAMHAISKAGVLVVLTARLDGVLVGYFTWNIQNDIESKGLKIGLQGAWFVSPDAPRRTAVWLWERSVREMQAMGVQCIFPHHRTQGRGANIGKFFMRRGAKPIQTTYSLWIGD